MTTKNMMMAANLVAVLLLGSAGAAVAHDCHKCDVNHSNVTYHAPEYGAFHEQMVPTDAQGNPLACLDITGTSTKVGVDWTYSTGDGSAWGTHTTKYNSATVVEERYR